MAHVTKPISREELEEAFRKIEDVSADRPKRVLVVEDDENDASAALWSSSETADVKVDEAATGKQAYRGLALHAIRLRDSRHRTARHGR